MVLFDQATYDKLLSEVPKYKLITPSILSDRLRVCLCQLSRLIYAAVPSAAFIMVVKNKCYCCFYLLLNGLEKQLPLFSVCALLGIYWTLVAVTFCCWY